MWTNFKLSWRNTFRNKRRTLLASIVIATGLAALMFSDALTIGMTQAMIKNATSTFLGDAQIHAKDFLLTQDTDKLIQDLPSVESRLLNHQSIKNFAIRTRAFAMVASSNNVESVGLFGIQTEKEKALSKLRLAMVSGSYFKEASSNTILIGSKLAQSLEVGLGDRIVITLAQIRTGELSQALFRVGGVFEFQSRSMDKSVAFITIDKARELLGIQNGAHEIAIKLEKTRQEGTSLGAELGGQGNVTESWSELMPGLRSALSMSEYSIWIVGVILFAIISVGIINTLFMSIYERMFEFGVIKAIGTRPWHVFEMILMEAFCLGAISSLLGILLGSLFIWYFGTHGIDFGGIEYAGVSLREPIYTIPSWKQYTLLPVWVIAITLVASIYPALYAARLMPARAMQKSL